MDKRKILHYLIPICFIILLIILAITSSIIPDIGNNTSYFCDVKALSLKTYINISKNDEKIVSIQGEFLRFFTDPLTMYNNMGQKIAYGSDKYHFITQDSHTIIVNEELKYEMVGKFNLGGNKYDIYDASGNLVANANFNMFHTYGTIQDTSGVLWADYHSNLFRKDYTVRVKDECQIDEKSLLMIMASFYSDKAADSSTGSNSQK